MPPSLPGSEGFFTRLLPVALGTDSLQVPVVIRAVFRLRDNVVDSASDRDLANLEARLAETVVTLENSDAGLVPLAAVATLVATTSPFIGELPDLAIGLVSLAVA